MKLLKKSSIITLLFVILFPTYVFAASPNVPQPDAAINTQQLVWVPTNGGTKYHTKETCSGMKSPICVTLTDAINVGFTACSKCCKSIANTVNTANTTNSINANVTVGMVAASAVAETPTVAGQSAVTVPTSATGYVWVPKSGKKYHSSPSCSNMKSPNQVTESQAISCGYTKCSKCY